jgi:hypothetical protein
VSSAALAALPLAARVSYRLHASRAQMRLAYLRLDEFIAAKRHFDPQLRFSNALWDTYLA